MSRLPTRLTQRLPNGPRQRDPDREERHKLQIFQNKITRARFHHGSALAQARLLKSHRWLRTPPPRRYSDSGERFIAGAGSMPSSGLYLAREPADRPLHGIMIGTGNARHSLAAPVNRTPFAVVFRPGDAAQAWREIDRFIVLRLDDHLSGGVDQPPLAVLEKGQEAILEGDADALG